ncbi:MAG TPA: EndoU domain-containing protein [Pirellulales bacterium]|nr:EndoU domain-containing protein [Pirellulales bacterium]
MNGPGGTNAGSKPTPTPAGDFIDTMFGPGTILHGAQAPFLAPYFQQMLGDEFLVNASPWQLFGVTAATAAAMVAAFYAGTPMLGLSGLPGAMSAGAMSGVVQYGVSQGGAYVISGGQAPAPTPKGFVYSGLGGAAGGAAGYGLGKGIQALSNKFGGGPPGCGTTGVCFVAGTQVVVPGDAERFVAEANAIEEGRIMAAGGLELSNRWLWSLLIVGVGVAGYRRIGARKRREEEEAVERAATETLFHKLEEDDMLGKGKGDRTKGGFRLRLNSLQGTVGEGFDGDAFVVCDETLDELCDALCVGEISLGLVSRGADVRQVSGENYMPAAQVRGVATPTPEAAPRDRRAQPMPVPRRPAPAGKRRSLNRLGLTWLAACLLLAGWIGFGGSPSTPIELARRPGLSAPTLPIVATQSHHRTRNIEDIRVGQRVVAHNPDLTDAQRRVETAVDQATWKLVRLHAESRWPDGTLDTFEIETLQPPEWLATCTATLGATVPIPIDLVEMGVSEDLSAEVAGIEPCPEIAAGPGSVVLTTINHLNPFVVQLTVASQDGREQTVNPTGWHKFHREKGNEWVSAVDLREGDVVGGLNGPLTVVALKRVPGTHRVYNMTVEREHVYFVLTAGLLGHNANCGDLVDLADAKARQHILGGDATGGGHRFGTGIPGKSEFPADWSDEMIMNAISDVATNPGSTTTAGRGGRAVIDGTSGGVNIRVITEPGGGRIVTGFPTNTAKNP